ncbi:16S rRNA (adenine(1518)-N(6)/adenine(1519)-N(6))-dimethyltransferase RsmA [Irregularibacter muris]|uniref:Ribosomal RNA small subunit methyltransferase A n=1 Tax=Irregularibacter muris TaxID=1796619 RepID=A0AAE3HI26_9FIRM|nr:16S rRNA (adenine(1518)-N(6)/adenine(1519)-N(6))-dimethyltransferase RsmA [Irregularibacter muris]MCR1899518.1 16S rRNA (adenine(1518)-N(6)/adenine(1519)-N(6))-dimethyltransferase RsmA [Irregularibacter muris]
MKNLASPKVTREIIEKYGFRFSKSLGQNFLIDSNILDKIIDGAGIHKDYGVLEIGPGIGTMTQKLAQHAHNVLAIEIDRALLPILRETLGEYTNVQVLHGDVLKLPLKEHLRDYFGDRPIKVVANLPYYVTTSIVMKLLEEDLPLESITILIQKEVAERMQASPGGKDYGALSVAVQFYAQPRIIGNVPPSVFIPAPKVESTIISLDILKEPRVLVKDKKLFFAVVKAAFGKRRKTLLNALSSSQLEIEKGKIKEVLKTANIDATRRGETLSLEEFAHIANSIAGE